MKRIAIQGIAGSFHEDAARQYFKNEEIEIVECRSFTRVCEMVDNDEVDLAVMAIENSIAGSLLQNYSLIKDYHLHVIGETYVHIKMNLMALEGVKLSDIETIYSHPVAIHQCIEYIEKYLPNAQIIENQDTAMSGKIVQENQLKNAAAIGNLRTAELYNLKVLDKGIETNKRNYTRFWVLDKRSNPNHETNKASIALEVGNYSGSLAQVLNIFTENNLNLNMIQSIPIVGKPSEYTIHIDVEYDEVEYYEKAIHQILKCVSSLSVIGEYQKGRIK